MAIPASFTDYLVALHRLVTREEILKDSGFNMVSSRLTVCGGRTLIEGPTRGAFTSSDAFGEDRVLLPEGEDLMFGGRQVDRRS